MRLSRFYVVLACAAVVGCQSGDLTPQQRSVEAQIVRDRLTLWANTINNREIDSLKAMYFDAPELTASWPSGAQARGPEELDKSIQDLYNLIQYLNFVVQSPDILVLAPNVAVVTFRHSMDVRYFDTRREPFAGFVTLVWVKDAEDGRWKILKQQISRNIGQTG